MNHFFFSSRRFLSDLTVFLYWGASRPALLLGLLLLAQASYATTIITVGTAPGADYPSIGAALAAVPSPLPQAYELQLLDAAYAEDVTLSHSGTAANTLTIRPATGVTSVVTGTLTFGAGSQYVVLSGNNGSTLRALTLRQPSLLVPTVVFGGDASHNAVQDAIIRGSNTLLTSGVVLLGSGTVSGNDDNVFSGNLLANDDPGLLPANLVYAANAGGGTNDGFSLSNNELKNFGRTGLLVGAGNGDQWLISGNSFYYSAAAVPTTAQTAIDYHPGSAANDVTVSNNFIGGRAAGGAGGLWENAGSQGFRGIVMDCGNSAVLTNEVSGNSISSVSLTGFGSGALTALAVTGGRNELASNSMWGVANAGTSGVNSLVSNATTVLLDCTVSSGQLMVVEGGQTIVLGNLHNAGILNHTGGNILINGSFTNTGTFAQTLGDLEVKGDMLNTGQFTCSTGTVRLSGNGPQLVSGGLYFNLEVNGPGPKTLTDDLEVYNGVQMLAGVLATGAYRVKLDPLANLTETDASYVLGRVEARRTPTAGVLEDFGGVGLLMLPAVASTLPGSTLVSRVTGVASVGVDGHQSILRYFDVTAPVSTGLNINLTMSYLPHELNGIAPANLRFQKSLDAGATWQNRGISSSGLNVAMLNNVDGFSRWTLGDVLMPLPVELLGFRAERRGEQALLRWATASERDNRGFGVEVSADGKVFRSLGFVEGAGSSSAPHSYSFLDNEPAKAGLRYYRLRQDDRNGQVHYFGPQALSFEGSVPALTAFPSHFAEELSLTLSSATPADVQLLDNLGRVVWQQQGVAANGASVQLHPACAAGSYVLAATVAGQVLRQRVVKE